jgi:hypothetical protein
LAPVCKKSGAEWHFFIKLAPKPRCINLVQDKKAEVKKNKNHLRIGAESVLLQNEMGIESEVSFKRFLKGGENRGCD